MWKGTAEHLEDLAIGAGILGTGGGGNPFLGKLEALEHLKRGDYDKWKDVKLSSIEQSGQQEVLNWFCLVGAMFELERPMELLTWAETWTFNAPKCMALFK